MSKYPDPGTAAREVKAGGSFWHRPSTGVTSPSGPGFSTCFVTPLNQNFFVVLAGVGTRNYYRKIGYELEGPYMVKRLD